MKILNIAKITFIENLRNKLFLIILLFGIVIFFISLLIATLAVEQKIRLLIDLGLGSIEFIGLISTIFLGVNSILEEVESKTIYLLIVRPINRVHFIIGKYLGILFSLFIAILIMVLIHLIILFIHKWWETQQPFLYFFISIPLVFFKITIITAIGMFFSIFSTSKVASYCFTFFIWILGHFSSDLLFFLQKTKSLITKFVLYLVIFITPKFEIFNFRDFLEFPKINMLSKFAYPSFYLIVYVSFCLTLCCLLFQKKEF